MRGGRQQICSNEANKIVAQRWMFVLLTNIAMDIIVNYMPCHKKIWFYRSWKLFLIYRVHNFRVAIPLNDMPCMLDSNWFENPPKMFGLPDAPPEDTASGSSVPIYVPERCPSVAHLFFISSCHHHSRYRCLFQVKWVSLAQTYSRSSQLGWCAERVVPFYVDLTQGLWATGQHDSAMKVMNWVMEP